MSSSSESLINSFNERISTAKTQEDVHLERIIVLDDAKNEYNDIITRIDKILLGELNTVNDSIEAVNDAYQNRINSGCRTDLFWRLVDVQVEETTVTNSKSGSGTSAGPPKYSYTYECVRISPSGYPSVGEPPPPTSPFSMGIVASRGVNAGPSIGASVGVSTTTVEYVADDKGTHESVPLDSLFGFRSENLYGLKMYDEPYTRDIGDTFVTSFIGTCAATTNYVIAMTPNISGGISNIRPGQLLITDKVNLFNTDAYVITGISTATANLSGINTTADPDTVSDVVVPKIILDDTAIQSAYAPEDDGNYVTFTVLSDPDNFGDLSLERDASPYVPQTIKCPMQTSDAGKGVRVEFDNSGAGSGTATWNQFLEGQPDPDAKITGENESEIRRKLKEATVKEPPIGAGKIFHKLGFEYAPVVYTDSGRSKYRLATEGETVVMRNKMGQPSLGFDFGFGFGYNTSLSGFGDSAGVIKLPSCNSSATNLIQSTEQTSAEIINGLSSSTTENNIEVVNMLRNDLMDINIRIWSERQLLGDAIERQGTYSTRLTDVANNRQLIDGE